MSRSGGADTFTQGHPVLATAKPDTASGCCRSHFAAQTVRALAAAVAATTTTAVEVAMVSHDTPLDDLLDHMPLPALPKIGTLARPAGALS